MNPCAVAPEVYSGGCVVAGSFCVNRLITNATKRGIMKRDFYVEAAERGFLSIAEIFGVGISFIKKKLKSHRDEEGPVTHRGNGVALPLDDEQLAALRAAIEICPGATLEELQRLIADECKVMVSQMSICRALKKLNLPLVKGG
jgi:transposase